MSCMCGAQDCPSCYPEHFRPVYCLKCGKEISFNDDEAEGGFCGDCFSDGWSICDACGNLYQETDETPDCPECGWYENADKK